MTAAGIPPRIPRTVCTRARIVVRLLADAVSITETSVARLGLTLYEVDRVTGVREIAHLGEERSKAEEPQPTTASILGAKEPNRTAY